MALNLDLFIYKYNFAIYLTLRELFAKFKTGKDKGELKGDQLFRVH